MRRKTTLEGLTVVLGICDSLKGLGLAVQRREEASWFPPQLQHNGTTLVLAHIFSRQQEKG
ncbi:hypothetical protein E2C01_095678 [Portunus trituberculatus]|uniref:Uncharacterized protein n=1 Tax=Portunus trituberculatus TaxID=210409 RepID=A0A5B7K4M5_PORTR|nr:hypothetical protein [Portunus trituberculatus]